MTRDSAKARAPSATEFDRFIEQQLGRTRRRVWSVDLIGALLVIVVGALVWMAAMVLVDHWLVTGGLGFRGRLVALLVLFIAATIYSGMVVLPLVIRRINPLYAAATIEQSRPGLKNSLINLLMLRGRQQDVSEVVYHAIEQRAAQDLSAVTAESAVDRSRLIVLGYMILAVVACGALYKVLSPKDPILSVERVLAPWAEIQPPTRVQIGEVDPGSADRYYDQRLSVTAQVHGLRQDEPVTLYYSTRDGQIIDRAVRMNAPDEGFRWSAELPDSGSGLQQDLEYYLRAGDATTPRYHVAVLTVPAIMVERAEYKYPAYTELPPRVAERQGDLRAIEGTQVTLHTKATHDIRSAHVDFDRDGRRDLSMRATGRTAVVAFTLKLKRASDLPEHANYQLLFTTTDGTDNPAPIEHKIEVVRDLPPEVAIVEPVAAASAEGASPAELSIGERGTLRMAVEASDPDFRLASVKLMAERNGKALLGEELLPKARGGRFRGSYFFDAKKYQLKAGDRIEYWAVAVDNKQPEPNVSETRRYALRISSKEEQPPQDQLADARAQPKKDEGKGQQAQGSKEQDKASGGNRAPDENRKPEASGGKQDDAPKPRDEQGSDDPPKNGGGQQASGGQQANDGQQREQGQEGQGQAGDENRRVDPDADPGQAIEKINEHFDQKEEGKGEEGRRQKAEGSKEKAEGSKQQDNASGGNNAPGENGDKQPAGSKPQDAGTKKGNDPQQAAGNQQPQRQPNSGDNKQETNKVAGEPKGDEPKDGESKADEPKNAGQKSGQKREADNQPASGGSNAPGQSGKQEAGKQEAGKQEPGKQESQGTKPQSGSEKQPTSKPQDGGGDKPEAGATPKGDNEGSKDGGAQGKQQSSGKAGDKSEGSEQGNSAAGGKQGDKPGQGAGEKDQPGEKSQPGDGAQPGDTAQPRPDDQGQSGAKPQSGDGGKADAAIGDKDKAGAKPDGGQQPEASNGTEGENAGTAQSSKGAGQSSGDKQANPAAQQENRPRDKPAGDEGNSEAKRDGTDATSPARDKTDSNTQGESSGDVKGAGQDGGGQRASKPGTGGPGENTSADDGGGKSNEKGEGETSGKAGDQAESGGQKAEGSGQKASGQKGEKPGEGNNAPGESGKQGDESGKPKAESGKQEAGGEKPAANDNKPKGNDAKANDPKGNDKASGDSNAPGQNGNQPAAGDKPDRQPSGGKGTDGQPGPSKPGEKSNALTGRGNPTVGGPTNGPIEPIHEQQSAEPGGDDPNLAYARKATDLAIDRLKDQMKKGEPDQELLDRLKWTKDDLKRFVEHWQRMKQAAAEPTDAGRAAQEELDKTLRNLGLRPHGTTIGGNTANDDRTRAMRQTRRTAPPAEYADQYRAYTTGTSKAKE